MFSENEQRELLAIARAAIEYELKGIPHRPPASVAERCAQPAGAFVTIKIEGELRGCIGYIESAKPLAEVVAEVAAKAATDDPRFPRMTLEECKRARLEISILSPLRRIRSLEEIEIGKHGLVVAAGEQRGVLLPQVAVEHRLDPRTFFEATVRKAGISLPPRDLAELGSSMELFVFEAEVLREDSSTHDGKKVVRRAAVAGTFYPADADELQHHIADLMGQVRTRKLNGKIRGIVSPHAGYMYSGLTAAHAYAMLRGEKFDTVVVISPSHREFFSGVSVYSGQAYETPLGLVAVNARLRDALVESAYCIVASERGHRDEHALEVQLPFLQQVLPPFSLLPLVIGDQKRAVCIELGEALARVLKEENALLVASTDLSHFYNAQVAHALDSVMINDVREFNPDKLMRDLERQRTEACGGGPVVAVLTALKRLGVDKIEVLHRSTSGDVSGDYGSVVGYVSAVAYS